MDIRKLQRLVIDALEDVKAQDIVVYNTTELSDLFDRVVLVSGTSNRHTRSLAASVVDKVKQAGGHVVSVEGEDSGEWVLVDLGDVVVHIMLPPTREHYALEEIWGGKTVRVKLGAGTSAPTPRSLARSAAPAPARVVPATKRRSRSA
jgi:ribosome-associated protein